MEMESTGAMGARSEPRSGMAVASLVLGIASLLLFCVLWISVPAAVAAIVLGVLVQRRRDSVSNESLTMATVGLTCGSVAMALVVAVLLFVALSGTYYDQPSDGQMQQPAPPQQRPLEPLPPPDAAPGTVTTPAEERVPLRAEFSRNLRQHSG